MSFSTWRQVQRLKNNVYKWNQWRKSNPDSPIILQRIDLHRADLYGADLHGADLQWANLSGTNLSDANLSQANLYGVNLTNAKLSGANLTGTRLCGASLKRTNLKRANLDGADLYGADLSGANLTQANLHKINLQEADLSKANLNEVNLREVDLSHVNLNGLNLRAADLSQTNLSQAQVLGTRFEKALFTGSCLEDWHVNSTTTFNGARCDYIYLKADQQDRRPKYGIFEPGEFAALFQQTTIIDLPFKDGINWQAFSQAFDDLRSQYTGQYLAIQAIEKKLGDALIIRLEVPANTDISTIKSRAQAFYDSKLTLIEKQYRAELNAQEDDIVAARELCTNLVKMTELLATKSFIPEGHQLAIANQTNNGAAHQTSDDLPSMTDDLDIWA